MAKNIEENLIVRDKMLLELTQHAMDYCCAIYNRYNVIPKKATIERNLRDKMHFLCEKVEDFEIEMVVSRVQIRWSKYLQRVKKYKMGVIKKLNPPSVRSGYILESTKTYIAPTQTVVI